jgi:predicted Zn-dependent peptidase
VQDWRLTELDSGERVISERLDHVRSAAVGYWIGAGSRDEQPAEAGVTHFIEHLLFKGTERFTALQIAEIFDGLGGELNAATSREHTLLYGRIPDHHLETAMDVMGDMVFACWRRSRCTRTRRRSSCTTSSPTQSSPTTHSVAR